MLWPVLLAALVVLYVALESLTPGIHHVTLQTGICLIVGLVIPLFRQTTSRVFNRATHLVARYSYGIYLFHVLALWLGYYAIAPESEVLKALIALSSLTVLSVASYHLLEAPMVRLGARLSRPPLSPRCESEDRLPARDTS